MFDFIMRFNAEDGQGEAEEDGQCGSYWWKGQHAQVIFLTDKYFESPSVESIYLRFIESPVSKINRFV